MKFRELGKFREKDENPELQSRYRKKNYKCNAPSINNGSRASLTTVSSLSPYASLCPRLILEPVPFPWHGCPYIASNEHFWGGDSDTTFDSLRTDYRNFDPILLAKIVLRKTTLTMIGFHSLDVCKTLIRGWDMSEEKPDIHYVTVTTGISPAVDPNTCLISNQRSILCSPRRGIQDTKYWGMRWKNDDAIHWGPHVFPCHWHSRQLSLLNLYKK